MKLHLASFTLLLAAGTSFAHTVKQTGGANVRSGPSQTSALVGVASKGCIVSVLSAQKDGWRRVEKPFDGWIRSAVLENTSHTMWIVVAEARIRETPDSDAKSLKLVKKDAEVTTVYSTPNGGWVRVSKPVHGWILRDKLTYKQPVPELAKASGSNVFHLRVSRVGYLNLPSGGRGYVSGSASYRQWGRPRMINGLIMMGRAWYDGYAGPKGKKLRYGDISYENGGYMSPHVSHQRGEDCDTSMITDSGNAGICYYWYSAYNRAYTIKYVQLMHKVWNIDLILFNDSQVPGVMHYSGHDNHLHTRIYP